MQTKNPTKRFAGRSMAEISKELSEVRDKLDKLVNPQERAKAFRIYAELLCEMIEIRKDEVEKRLLAQQRL